MVTRVSILLLSEDGSDDAYDTVRHLARRMLLLLDSACLQHVRFEPLTNDQARLAVRGNVWKSTSPADRTKKIELMSILADKLLEGEGSFAFYHIDADRTWSAMRKGGSENLEKFRRFVEKDVLPFAVMRRTQRGLPPPQIDRWEERLLLLTPCYSIESWLYQNAAVAIGLCHRHYRGQHAERFAKWAGDRTLLDEIEKPKGEVCLGSKHNLELASESFPAQEVWSAGRSFTDTVQRLLDCRPLWGALTSRSGS